MRYAVLFLAIALFACSSTPTPMESETDGEGGSGSSSSSVDACEHVPPLLGYDPDSAPTGVLVPLSVDLDGVTASVLTPFPVGTTCQEVIVGMRLPLPSTAPPILHIVTFDSDSADIPSGTWSVHSASLADPTLLPTLDAYIVEYHFRVKTYHPAFRFPFVGTVVDPQFQIATMPECDPARTMRYRAHEFAGWSKLSAELDGLPLSGTHASLYYGLAECSPD